MKLQCHEIKLVGNWITEDGEARRDETCERIDQLIRSHLKEIAVSKQWGAWETLSSDRSTTVSSLAAKPKTHFHRPNAKAHRPGEPAAKIS
jgi:hypothetical protein